MTLLHYQELQPSPPPTGNDPNVLPDLLHQVEAALMPPLKSTEWAESEIEYAQSRNPTAADQLWHAFSLLGPPTTDAMRTEFVYRSHCRELLERIVAGGDTRRPTWAEIVVACSQASLEVPLNTAAYTLYQRAWINAFPDRKGMFGDHAPYEQVAGGRADDLERYVTGKLTVPSRVLSNVTCKGCHNTEPAPTCRYYIGANAAPESSS